MRRVCCLCESWASGGIESFLCNVMTRLDLTELQVDIVAAELRESVFTQTLAKLGVGIYPLSGSMRQVRENRRLFRALLRERNYDVIHLNAYQGLSLAYLRIAKQEGVPVRIAHSHNTALRKSPARPLKLTIHRWAKEQYTKDATELWACSKAAAEFLFAPKELNKRNFRFIPNGIDVERFRFDPKARETIRRELGVENSFVIGNVGRLCYQKNQGFLLDVLSKIVKQNHSAVLLLVGDGDDKPALIKKAEALGISDKVIFFGITPHPEHLLWAMDVFAFPSLFEGFGIAAIEAQAAGLPVFCSEHVPEEARATELMKVLPLHPGIWAEALYRDEMVERSVWADEVGKAGLCITEETRIIENRYLKADG